MYKDFESFGINKPEKILIELPNRGLFKYNVRSQRLSMAHLCEDMSEHIKY